MQPKLEETITLDFITSNPENGAAADADSTPTCEVFEDATDTAIVTPTCTKRTGKTGNYRVSVACTAANGFEAGKSYNVVISATVGSVAAKAVIRTFQVRAAATGDAMTLTGAYDAAKTASQFNAASDSVALSNASGNAIANAVASAITADHGVGSYIRNTEPPTAAENADKLLGRNIAGGSDGGRTVASALRVLRNRVVIDESANTITVYAEDDTTVAWSGALTASSSTTGWKAIDPG